MTKVALKGLLAHKLRLFMTALSIALGVAFVAGTFVLTDSLNSSFTQAFTSQYRDVDVAVRAETAFADSQAIDQREPVSAELLDTVQEVPGVAAAEGAVSGFATIVGADGTTLGAGALSTDGISAPTVPALAGDLRYSAGRAPAEPDEVALDAASADEGSLSVGDSVRILFRGPPREFTVVGIAQFGDADRRGSTTTALFDLATAQQVLGDDGGYDEIRIQAADGTSAEVLRDRVGQTLPAGVEAETGEAVAAEKAALVKENVSFISQFLLVFAVIAVFVGSFIIWNTFTILVAQRTRELALLRAIGATRRQVRQSVLIEALSVGLLASALGLGLGVGVAKVLVALLSEVAGLEIPSSGSPLTARTVLVSVLVGTVVTVVASVAPARRATRVAPIEALRDAAPGGYRFSARRALTGSVLTAAGLGAMAAGLFAGSGVAMVGVGVLVTFLGISALLPLLSRVLARVLGAPLVRVSGTTGRLARDNAMRNPKRTASTASALMIGLSLVASVTVLASSLKESIGSDVERTVTAELVVQKVGDQNGGLSPDVARAVDSVAGVESVTAMGYGRAKIDDQLSFLTPIDARTVDDAIDLGVTSGSVDGLTDGGVLVHEDTAEAKGWSVGSTVPVEWPQTGQTSMEVVGIFSERDAVGSDLLVSLETYDENASGRLDTMVFVTAVDGADVGEVQATVAEAIAAYADAQVLTADAFVQSISGQVDQMLLFVTALLLLAVFIALTGIVNTLALSVFERTREIGLLRAVGMTRRQVRGMIRGESVIIAAIGALTGSAVGIGFGVALVTALGDEGVSQLAVPGPRLAVYVLAAAVAGVLAALGPARRAAKVDVLRAVVSD